VPLGNIIKKEATHVFTHVQWNMWVYALSVQDASLPEGFAFAAPGKDGPALPTAFRICIG